MWLNLDTPGILSLRILMSYWSLGRFNEAIARPSLLLGTKHTSYLVSLSESARVKLRGPLLFVENNEAYLAKRNRSFKGTSGICCRSKLFSGERAAGTMPHYLLLGRFLPADGLLKSRSDAATCGLRLPPWTNDITTRGCGPARRPCRWRRKALRDPLLQEGRWVLFVNCSQLVNDFFIRWQLTSCAKYMTAYHSYSSLKYWILYRAAIARLNNLKQKSNAS